MGSGSEGASPGCPPGLRRDRKPPYRPLAEATNDESEQTFEEIAGVLVGFRMPDYEQGISVAGYHLHFLNDEHTAGGHAFDFVLEDGVVEISTVSEMRLSLPTTGPFLAADLTTRTWKRKSTRAKGEWADRRASLASSGTVWGISGLTRREEAFVPLSLPYLASSWPIRIPSERLQWVPPHRGASRSRV